MVLDPVLDEWRIKLCLASKNIDVLITEVLGPVSTNEGDQLKVCLDQLLPCTCGR